MVWQPRTTTFLAPTHTLGGISWEKADKYCYYRFHKSGNDAYQGAINSVTDIPGSTITCADENGVCKPANFVGDLCGRAPKSTVEVYYGRRTAHLGGFAAYASITLACSRVMSGLQFQCSNTWFGIDPYPGYAKYCYLRPMEVR